MARLILMDEFHVSLFVPRGLRETEYAAIRRVLSNRRFHARLGRAVREVIRRRAAPRKVRVRVTP